MSTLYNLFLEIGFTELIAFLIRLLIIPASFLILYWGILVLWLKFEKNTDNFLIHVQKIKLKVIISILFLIGIYFGVLIWSNGINAFKFLEFPFSLQNIYLLLLPLIVAYFITIYLYFNTKNKIDSFLK